MDNPGVGRLENALIAATAFIAFAILRWLWRLYMPPLPMQPRRVRSMSFKLFGSTLLIILVVAVLLLATRDVPRSQSGPLTIEEMEALNRTSSGWHVVGEEVFHDGVLDASKTNELRRALSISSCQYQQAKDRIDELANQNKDNLYDNWVEEYARINAEFEQRKIDKPAHLTSLVPKIIIPSVDCGRYP